jgi:zinc/manganese transport system permease protein
LALVIGLLCPLTGTLLLVQRRLFQANLISHAVLPGLALALALHVDPALGGAVSGVGGALVAERLNRNAPATDGGHEAVLNTVLAGFLGLGVLLIPLLHLRVDLEAVLFGDLLAAGPTDLVRAVAGVVQVLAAVGLMVPGRTAYGAALALAASLGALVAHASVLGWDSAPPAMVLAVASGVVLARHRADFQR